MHSEKRFSWIDQSFALRVGKQFIDSDRGRKVAAATEPLRRSSQRTGQAIGGATPKHLYVNAASCLDLMRRSRGRRDTDQTGSRSNQHHRAPDDTFVILRGEAHPLRRSLINMALQPISSCRCAVTKQ